MVDGPVEKLTYFRTTVYGQLLDECFTSISVSSLSIGQPHYSNKSYTQYILEADVRI